MIFEQANPFARIWLERAKYIDRVVLDDEIRRKLEHCRPNRRRVAREHVPQKGYRLLAIPLRDVGPSQLQLDVWTNLGTRSGEDRALLRRRIRRVVAREREIREP